VKLLPGRLFPRERLRASVFLAVALVATAAGLALYLTDPLHEIELKTVDTRFQIRGTQRPRSDLVVVAIDQPTLGELGLQFPYPRRVEARVLDNILRDGPKAVAFDIQFGERSSLGIKDDIPLVTALQDSDHKVVLANDDPGPKGQIIEFGTDGNKLLAEVGSTPAVGQVPNDPDGVIRRMYSSFYHLPGLDVATARVATGHRIHAPPGSSAWIDYYGPPGTIPAVSFASVYRDKLRRGFFHNKIVVVGATESTLQDVHETPFSQGLLMSGPEIHAQAIGTILAGFPLRHVSTGIDILLILLMGLLVPLTSIRLSFKASVPVMVAVAAALTFGAQIAFDDGRIVTFTYPVIALMIAIVGSLGGHYVLSGFEQARVHDLFSRFVPGAVVDQVIARTDKDLRLGAVRREGTVMFTDLRGFTSFAEALEPERVVQVINQYLGGMTESILEHGGTLVSFMGDGIFALWGAPLEMEDHADRALRAAREMLAERLPRFNAWLAESGFEHAFRMGIGLNSGPVMSGNVGSERRLEYAAIGDTTNTASRLEGMTKGTAHQLFIAESTRLALHAVPDDLVYVDEFPIRGKQATLTVWSLPETPAGEPKAAPPDAPAGEPKVALPDAPAGEPKVALRDAPPGEPTVPAP
jgi:adenylate cyclase